MLLHNPVRKVIFRQYKTWRGYQARIGKKGYRELNMNLELLELESSWISADLEVDRPPRPLQQLHGLLNNVFLSKGL